MLSSKGFVFFSSELRSRPGTDPKKVMVFRTKEA